MADDVVHLDSEPGAFVRLGLAITAVWYILGTALVWVSTLAQTGYLASPIRLGITALAVVALGAGALALPAHRSAPRRPVDAPAPG